MDPTLPWTWFTNQIVFEMDDLIGRWEVVRGSDVYAIRFYPSMVLLRCSPLGQATRSECLGQRALRKKFKELRQTYVGRENYDEYLDHVRNLVERDLLLWAESIILTPMEQLNRQLNG